MKIKVEGFESGTGVRFLMTADNLTEEALLAACIPTKGDLLQESGDKSNEFYLRLPVHNG